MDSHFPKVAQAVVLARKPLRQRTQHIGADRWLELIRVVLSRLRRDRPDAVDKLTPPGRLPTEGEAKQRV